MYVILIIVSLFLLISAIVFYLRWKYALSRIDELLVKLRDSKENIDDKIPNQDMFYQSRLAQMGEMISMIAHQWRQPLTAISLTAIALETKVRLHKLDFTTPEGIEQAQQYILGRTDLIAQYVNSMTTTIDDFRMFYKRDRHKELTSLEDIVDRSMKIIGASLESKEISIIKDCRSKRKIWVFPNELVQVFLNLFQNSQDQFASNAIKDAQITITSYDTPEGVSIEFLDNAGGINGLVIEKIFRPYFSTKDKQNGTGLGLYMSKTIIDEHHNGTIKAINRENGACFIITLPLNTEEFDD